jgi:hypothetical protein
MVALRTLDRQDETLFFSYHLEYGFRIALEASR